jgi:hypothetical protein
VLTLVGLFAMGGGVGMLAGTMIPAERLTGMGARKADRVTSFGVDSEEARGVLSRIRFLGAAYVAASLAMLAFRRPLARTLDAVVRSAPGDLAALRRAMVGGIRDGEALEMLAVTLVAIAVRLPFLNCPMRYDETYTFFRFVKKGPPFILTAFNTNNHILQNLLAWVGITLFGISPVSQRLGTFIAGCLLVPLAYVAARAIWDRATAVLASALVATAPYLVFLSANARGYTLVLCCYAGCLALCPYLRRTNSPAGWTAFAALAALGMLSIPIMVYPLIATAAWIVACAGLTRTEVPPLRFLGHAIAAAGLTAFLFFVVYTPSMIGKGLTVVFINEMSAAKLTRGQWIREIPDNLGSVWAGGATPLPAWAAPGVAALVLIEVFFYRRRALSPSPLPPALLSIPVVLFLQRLHPMTRVQSYAFLLTILCLSAGATRLIAAIVEAPARRALATWALAVAAATGLVVANIRGASDLDETGTCRDARAMAEYFRTCRPDDYIALSEFSDIILPYYFLIDGFPTARIGGRPGPSGPAWLLPAAQWDDKPGPEGSTLFVVAEGVSLELAASHAELPPQLVSGLREYKQFPRGGRIYRCPPMLAGK